MRFVLSYSRGSLSPIGDRIRKEGHQVAKGHTTTNGTLLISDVPLDPIRCNGEGIGVSRFTLLLAKSVLNSFISRGFKLQYVFLPSILYKSTEKEPAVKKIRCSPTL